MIRIRLFSWQDFQSVAYILLTAFPDFYSSLGFSNSNMRRVLYLRLRYGRLVSRIKHVLVDFSPKLLFDSTHDPAVFVAETSENKVVGVATVNNVIKAIWSLDQLAVLPEYRSQGIGSQLVREIVSYVRNKGGKTLSIGTDRNKPHLLEFYGNLGFKVSDEIQMSLDME
jgi:ribosomal protein S18 acetylase RimI-like enzyme